MRVWGKPLNRNIFTSAPPNCFETYWNAFNVHDAMTQNKFILEQIIRLHSNQLRP